MTETGNEEVWARGFFERIDQMRPELLDDYLDDGVRLQFANFPAVHGRDGIRGTLTQIASLADKIHHDITGIWRGMDDGANVVCVESLVTYVLRSQAEVVIPATSTLRVRNGKIVDYRIFADPAPLFRETA